MFKKYWKRLLIATPLKLSSNRFDDVSESAFPAAFALVNTQNSS
jgi:hypothetical protein